MSEQTDNHYLQIIWDYMAIHETPRLSDIIVVGGCTDPGPAIHAATLYRAGFAPLIVCSGYQQQGMSMTEADFHADIVKQHGVPESAILREPLARNTGQNITFTDALLKKTGLHPKCVILIHKPYMARRFLATAEAQWPDPQPAFIIQHEPASLHEYMQKQDRDIRIRKMLGDFSRIRPYGENGFQSKQPVPGKVQDAFEILVSRNYQIR